MAANQIPTYVFDTVVPIAIVVMIYYLLDRLQRRSLSRPVHTALRVTRTILVIWGTCLLVAAAIGGMFSRMFSIFWECCFMPATIGSFSLVWSVITLWEFRTKSSDVAVRVTSRVQVFIALVVLAFAVMALIGYSYRDQQLGIASDNNIAPERLRAMYHSWHARMDTQVMKRLAGNTATPEDVLQQLAVHDDIAIRNNVCNNTATPLSLLQEFANNEEPSLRGCVARHPALPLELQLQLAGDGSTTVRWVVLSRPEVSREVLVKLENDPDESIRRLVQERYSQYRELEK